MRVPAMTGDECPAPTTASHFRVSVRGHVGRHVHHGEPIPRRPSPLRPGRLLGQATPILVATIAPTPHCQSDPGTGRADGRWFPSASLGTPCSVPTPTLRLSGSQGFPTPGFRLPTPDLRYSFLSALTVGVARGHPQRRKRRGQPAVITAPSASASGASGNDCARSASAGATATAAETAPNATPPRTNTALSEIDQPAQVGRFVARRHAAGPTRVDARARCGQHCADSERAQQQAQRPEGLKRGEVRVLHPVIRRQADPCIDGVQHPNRRAGPRGSWRARSARGSGASINHTR